MKINYVRFNNDFTYYPQTALVLFVKIKLYEYFL